MRLGRPRPRVWLRIDNPRSALGLGFCRFSDCLGKLQLVLGKPGCMPRLYVPATANASRLCASATRQASRLFITATRIGTLAILQERLGYGCCVPTSLQKARLYVPATIQKIFSGGCTWPQTRVLYEPRQGLFLRLGTLPMRLGLLAWT